MNKFCFILAQRNETILNRQRTIKLTFIPECTTDKRLIGGARIVLALTPETLEQMEKEQGTQYVATKKYTITLEPTI